MGLRPPGQAGRRHLGGDERPRRLARGEQPHPAGVERLLVAAELFGVDLGEVGEAHRDGLRLEEGGLRPGAGLGRARWRVRRYGRTPQPGEGGRRRVGFAEPALVAQQQGLGGLHVVTPLDADARAQESRVDPGGGAPDPAGDAGPGADRLGQRRLPDDRARERAVGGERRHLRTAALGRDHRPPFAHTYDSCTRDRQRSRGAPKARGGEPGEEGPRPPPRGGADRLPGRPS